MFNLIRKHKEEKIKKKNLSEFKIQFGNYLATIIYQIWNMSVFQDGFLEKQLYQFHRWKKYFSQMAIFEFLNFFVLKINAKDVNDEILSPSPVIECIWQALLLRPIFYSQICHRLAGNMINYNLESIRSSKRFKKTIELYLETYNKTPNIVFWHSLGKDIEIKENVNLKEIRNQLTNCISHGERFSEFELRRRWPRFDKKEIKKLYVNLITSSFTNKNQFKINQRIFKDKDEKFELFENSYNYMKEGIVYFLNTLQQINGIITFWAESRTRIIDIKNKLCLAFVKRTPDQISLKLNDMELLSNQTLLSLEHFQNKTIKLKFVNQEQNF